MITLTPIYAALAVLFYIFLSIRVIGLRRSTQTSLGDGGHDNLQQAIRVHGNFSEYVPMALLLMLLAELQSAPALWLHAIGVATLAGRLIHAYAIPGMRARLAYRVAGMMLTFAALIGGALLNLWLTLLS